MHGEIGGKKGFLDGGHSGPDTSGPLSPRGLNVLFTGLKVLTLDIQAPYIIYYIFSLNYSLILFIMYSHEKNVGLQIADKEIILFTELASIKFHFIRGIYEKN